MQMWVTPLPMPSLGLALTLLCAESGYELTCESVLETAPWTCMNKMAEVGFPALALHFSSRLLIAFAAASLSDAQACAPGNRQARLHNRYRHNDYIRRHSGFSFLDYFAS